MKGKLFRFSAGNSKKTVNRCLANSRLPSNGEEKASLPSKPTAREWKCHGNVQSCSLFFPAEFTLKKWSTWSGGEFPSFPYSS